MQDCDASRVNGRLADSFKTLHAAGVHMVRVRLWNDSDPDLTNYSNFKDVVKTLRRSK